MSREQLYCIHVPSNFHLRETLNKEYLSLVVSVMFNFYLFLNSIPYNRNLFYQSIVRIFVLKNLYIMS